MIISEIELQYLIYIVKILIYFLFIFIVYKISLYEYKIKGNISYCSIILISILYGCCSIFLDSEELVMDRFIYALLYNIGNDIAESESIGLDLSYKLFRYFSCDIDVVFFCFSFTYMLLTLLAYKLSNQSTPRTLLLLLFSLYFLYGFSILKQEVSIAFMNFALLIYFNNSFENNKSLNYLMILIFIYLATLFHEAAYIGIPIFLLLIFWDNKMVRIITYVSFILIILLLGIYENSIYLFLGDISGTLSTQTQGYADKTGGINNIFTIFKGIPIYIIAYIGYRDRYLYSGKILNYDRYLLISIIASLFVILSMYSYWYFRFSMFFYLTIFDFIGRIYIERQKELKNTTFYYIILYGFLALSIKEIFQLYFKYGGF